MMTDLAPDLRLQHQLRRISRWLVMTVVVIVLLILSAWQLNIDILRRPLPGTPAMNPLTAISFLLLTTAFFLMQARRATPGMVKSGRVLVAVVLMLVSLRLIAELFGFPFTADLLFFKSRLAIDADHAIPSRMALITAATMIMLASALLLLPEKSIQGAKWSQIISLLALLPAFFSLLGYLYRVREFYGIFRHAPMALPTALCCLLFALALLFSKADTGIMKDFTSQLAGGMHARLFIPVAVIVPVLLGLLRLFGYWGGLFSTEFGVTILVSSIIIVFVGAIWYAARLLNRRDLLNQAMAADLAASENRSQLLINSVQDYAIFMLDSNGNIASWNTGAQKIKGYRGEEVIGKPISIFYTTDDIEKGEPQRNLAMAKANGRHTSEGWRVRKDGTRFWGDIVFTALLDDRGELKGFAKITRDRTDFKNAQEQIAYQARLMEDTSDAIISTDPASIIVSWNKGAELLYGHHAREVIGRRAGEVFGAAWTEEEKTAVHKDLDSLGHWTGEVMHIRKDNTPVHLLLSVSETRDIQGALRGYVMVGRDITQRKAEEDQLRQFNEQLENQVREKTAELTTVFERMSDGIMAFDRTGLMTYVNRQAAIMNRCRPEDLIGHNFWQRFPSAVQNEFGENFHRAMDTQQNIHFEMFSPSLQLWIECFMYPSGDGLSLFFRDISEKRKAEEAIHRTSEELRQLASHLQDIREEERATIAREIHDELGQQLTGIKMDMSWIAKRWGKGPDDALSSKIQGTLGLLDNTINTVRRIATELRPSILDDLGLVAAIEWQSQEFTRRSGIEATFHSAFAEFPFEPATAIGLFRICQESLTNVARHAGANHVWIDLDSFDDRLMLRIRDDGRGIDPNTTGQKKTLGLVGMRERAVMMGGELLVSNARQGGLLLEVNIPLHEKTNKPE